MPEKKIPIRMCSGCSGRFPKKELLRIVKSPDGEISLDLTGKKSGRGAYVCRNVQCLRKARKAKKLERIFETEIPEDVYSVLEKEMESEAGR
jgi:predicted RNA-binding protein YlxR (DUF448 family)